MTQYPQRPTPLYCISRKAASLPFEQIGLTGSGRPFLFKGLYRQYYSQKLSKF